MNISTINDPAVMIDYRKHQVLDNVLNTLGNLRNSLLVDRSVREKVKNSDRKTQIIFKELVYQTLALALSDDSELKKITANYPKQRWGYPSDQPTEWHVHFRMTNEQRDERYLITDVFETHAWPVALEITKSCYPSFN